MGMGLYGAVAGAASAALSSFEAQRKEEALMRIKKFELDFGLSSQKEMAGIEHDNKMKEIAETGKWSALSAGLRGSDKDTTEIWRSKEVLKGYYDERTKLEAKIDLCLGNRNSPDCHGVDVPTLQTSLETLNTRISEAERGLSSQSSLGLGAVGTKPDYWGTGRAGTETATRTPTSKESTQEEPPKKTPLLDRDKQPADKPAVEVAPDKPAVEVAPDKPSPGILGQDLSGKRDGAPGRNRGRDVKDETFGFVQDLIDPGYHYSKPDVRSELNRNPAKKAAAIEALKAYIAREEKGGELSANGKFSLDRAKSLLAELLTQELGSGSW